MEVLEEIAGQRKSCDRQDLVLGVGGAESDVAIGLRRLGIDTKWLGRVGDDPLVSQSPAKSGPRASKSTQSWIPTPRAA